MSNNLKDFIITLILLIPTLLIEYKIEHFINSILYLVATISFAISFYSYDYYINFSSFKVINDMIRGKLTKNLKYVKKRILIFYLFSTLLFLINFYVDFVYFNFSLFVLLYLIYFTLYSNINLSGLKELEVNGFLKRVKYKNNFGHWGIVYLLTEIPFQFSHFDAFLSEFITVKKNVENPISENPTTEIPILENPTLGFPMMAILGIE